MIGLLYESGEWSDFKLAQELEALGHSVCMINMVEAGAVERALSCSMLVSRVFASAQFRGNSAALDAMLLLLKQIEQEEESIPLINPACAHYFEVDKQLATQHLAECELGVPIIYACDLPQYVNPDSLIYPCMIKPNCGGRSNYSAIVQSANETQDFLRSLPNVAFLAEEYIASDHSYLFRAEVVGDQVPYVYRRSIGQDGLSSYHCGSSYVCETSPSPTLLLAIQKAADALSFELGSFDIIERKGRLYFIDANAVTNVSEDCNELLGIDLMKLHASYISTQQQECPSGRITK